MVNDYKRKFSKVYPTLSVETRAQMSKFVLGVSKTVVMECRTTMLVRDMDISRLITHAQQIGEENIKENERETKIDGTYKFGYF